MNSQKLVKIVAAVGAAVTAFNQVYPLPFIGGISSVLALILHAF